MNEPKVTEKMFSDSVKFAVVGDSELAEILVRIFKKGESKCPSKK
ncbi:hypothetical protein [Treponema bryantii]|nr:hypothetical protein [Treponema bryantii]